MVRRTAACCTVQLHANTRNYTGVAKSRLDPDATATRPPRDFRALNHGSRTKFARQSHQGRRKGGHGILVPPINNIVVSGGAILSAENSENPFGRSNPRWGSSQHSLRPLAGGKGAYCPIPKKPHLALGRWPRLSAFRSWPQ